MSKSFAEAFSTNVRQMLPFHVFVLVHTAIVLAIALFQAPAIPPAYTQYAEQLGALYFVLLPLALAITKAVLRAFGYRGSAAADLSLSIPTLLGRLASAGVTLGMFMLFMGSFTTFKTLMPMLIGGFPHDRLLADIDAALHGGVDPGAALIELLGYPLLLKGLQWSYGVLWMALTFVPIFFVTLDAPHLRLRYCMSFVLVWTILGNVLACAFLAAGPVFYADVTGGTTRFGAQMQVLDSILAPSYHAYLWQAYREGVAGLGTGISAFPSLHVGAAMMNALFLRDINRLAGFAGFAYVAIILLSSVLLGWHYAIDGYVSIIVVWLLHKALKRILDGEKNASSEEDTLTPSPSPATP